MLGPDSIVWRSACDWRILLVGGRSLLLQVAHPVVAAGVAEHSNFAADPWARLFGTLDLYVGGVMFGWSDAARSGVRLRNLHRRIKGADAAGRRYHALAPEAFHWVHATLVDGLAVLHERFGRPLSGEELARFYDEMREVGRLYGVRVSDVPPDWPAFRAYFDDMVRTRLGDNNVVRAVLDTLANAPRPTTLPVPDSIWRMFLWPPAGHLALLCTIGLLPRPLRERLRLGWTCAQELELSAYAALIRHTIRLLPARLRLHPWAREAFSRARSRGTGATAA